MTIYSWEIFEFNAEETRFSFKNSGENNSIGMDMGLDQSNKREWGKELLWEEEWQHIRDRTEVCSIIIVERGPG